VKNVIRLLSSRRKGLQQTASFFVLLAVVAALAGPGCSSSDNGTPSGPAACTLTSDCAKGLTCALGRCRVQCTSSVDCTMGGPGNCVVDITTGLAVCEPKNAPCEKQADCKAPLACASDYRCRNLCATDDDCNLFGTRGRVCAVDANMVKFCADTTDVTGMASGGMIASAPPSSVKTDAGVAPPSQAMIAMDLPDAAVVMSMTDGGSGIPDSTTGMGDSTMGMPDSTMGMGDSMTMGMPDGGPADVAAATCTAACMAGSFCDTTVAPPACKPIVCTPACGASQYCNTSTNPGMCKDIVCTPACGQGQACDITVMPPVCKTCGVMDGPCCPGFPCMAGLTCNANKVCECGKSTEVCCMGTSCSPGLSCVTPTGGGAATCICGQFDTKCCPASISATACDGELACAGTKCGCILEFQTGAGSGGSPGLALRTDGTIWKASNYAAGAFANVYRQVVSMSGSAALRVSTTAPGQIAISGGYNTFLGCAIVAGGEVNCFPLGDSVTDSTFLGAGLGATDTTAFPVPVVTDTTNLTHLANIVQISGGNQGSANFCAVDTGGNVWCWGYGQYGQLGYGDNSNVNHARKVKANASTDFSMVAEVRMAQDSTCARRTDGSVWCWGYDYQWQLGVDRTPFQANNWSSYYPNQVPILGTGKATRLAAATGQTNCALMDDSTVVCWGQNSNAQAGAPNDAMHQEVAPTTVTVGAGQGSLTGAIDVSSGSSGSMCVKTKAPDYAILCWGSYANNMPYPTPFKDNTQTAVTGIRSVLSGGYYYGYLGYVDPDGLVTSNGTPATLALNPPCSNLILPDGGIMP